MTVPAPNTFAAAPLDRAAVQRTDPDWVAERLADPDSRAVVASAEGPYLVEEDGDGHETWRPALVPAAEAFRFDGAEPILLGVDDRGSAIFAVDGEGREDLARRLTPAQATNLREAAGQLSQADGGLLAYATALIAWHRTHRFCPRCGGPTDSAQAGHVRICRVCAALQHPRTDPVVIALVHDGDRVLLGRQGSWPEGRFSALAGFAEPGESLEDAVAREIDEEAGVTVTDVRYRSSQPWPFPHSLMLGFHARYAGGEPERRDGELAQLRWIDRDELAAASTGEDGALNVPPPEAIARRLIDEWLEQEIAV